MFCADLSGKSQATSGAIGVAKQIVQGLQAHYPVRPTSPIYQGKRHPAETGCSGEAGERCCVEDAMAWIAVHHITLAFYRVS